MSLDERDIKHIREIMDIRIEHDRLNTDLRFRAEADARILAAAELARRLDVLNHAHQQATEVQNTYLPRETFEARMHDVHVAIAELKDFRASQLGRQVILTIIVPIVISGVMSLLVSHLR